MVVISRRGKVHRPVLRKTEQNRPGLLPRGVAFVDVVYWSAVAKTVEEADGIVMQRVDFVPTRVLVTDGRTEFELDLSEKVAEIVREAGWEPLFGYVHGE